MGCTGLDIWEILSRAYLLQLIQIKPAILIPPAKELVALLYLLRPMILHVWTLRHSGSHEVWLQAIGCPLRRSLTHEPSYPTPPHQPQALKPISHKSDL